MCYNPALVRDKPIGAPASVKLVYSTLLIMIIEYKQANYLCHKYSAKGQHPVAH